MKTNLQLKPTVFAIFGGSGDLTWRKLVPSLFDLFQDSSMPTDFSIIALDRIKLDDAELQFEGRYDPAQLRKNPVAYLNP